MLESRIKTRLSELEETLYHEIDRGLSHSTWQSKTHRYRTDPAAFAREVLNSEWWEHQAAVAKLLLNHRRVAVKSANGVGKTYLAADLALWFLYTHRPSIVVTTAPTARQVRLQLWQEIRKRHTRANSHYSITPPLHHSERLPGHLLTQRLMVQDGWYAIGLTANKADQFQGFHCENMLIIFDEASGIPESIWEASQGVAVAANNKILAIGNPLSAEGQFYRCFAGSQGWAAHTISALQHPNITDQLERIPGCTTIEQLESLIEDWCEPIDSPRIGSWGADSPLRCGEGLGEGLSSPSESAVQSSKEYFVTPARDLNPGTKPGRTILNRQNRAGNPVPGTLNPVPCSSTSPDIFIWDGIHYRPNNLFRARVLGEFPDGNDESLIPLRWIEAAVEKYENRHLVAEGYKRVAADVARFGDDHTVIGLRVGPVLVHMQVVHGCDTMEVAGRINDFAYKHHPDSIAVDSIGIGAGVVDRLRELGTDGVIAVNVSHAAFDPDRFANKRAELYWGLRERFHKGSIAIRREPRLIEELAAIRYKITSQGQIRIERKHEMKRRLRRSPDRADMLAILFDGPVEQPRPIYVPPSPAELLRREMEIW